MRYAGSVASVVWHASAVPTLVMAILNRHLIQPAAPTHHWLQKLKQQLPMRLPQLYKRY
ncbi:hypothetical protein OF001_U500004 [Pseudomonas sp. OF001]|nr:hypothetical protein OF001_U500004 [Pseudomonas sp. OF001]